MEHLSFSFVQVPLFLVSSSHLLFFSSSPPSPSFYSSPCVTCFSFFLSNDSLSPSSFSCVCCRVIPRPLLFFVYVLQAIPPPPFFCLCCKQLPPILFFVYAQNSIMLHVSYFQCLNSPLPFLYLCLELPILSQFTFLTSKVPTSPPLPLLLLCLELLVPLCFMFF